MPAAGAWAAVHELHFWSAMEEKMPLTSSLDRDDDVDVAASGVAVSALERERAAAAARDNRSWAARNSRADFMRRVHDALGVSLAAARDVRFGMRAQAAAAAAHLAHAWHIHVELNCRGKSDMMQEQAKFKRWRAVRGRDAMIHLRCRSLWPEPESKSAKQRNRSV
jgi:hypothetical protein